MALIQMSLPEFPEFTKLDIGHKDMVESITSRFEPYSDFNFTSLFSWDDGTTEVCLLKGNFVIKLADYITGNPIYSLLGENYVDASMGDLLSYTNALSLVPEVTIKNVRDKNRFHISEDRDNFDYIYGLRKLADLPGGTLKKKRNKANAFRGKFKSRSLHVRSRTLTDEQLADVEHVFNQWADSPRKSVEEIKSEHRALTRLVEHANFFDIYLMELVLDGKVVAFSINEKINSHYAICHFEKALPAYHKGNIYTYLSQQVARELLGLGCTHVNWEQDLGLPGLRKSKESYGPDVFLKKYDVRRPAT